MLYYETEKELKPNQFLATSTDEKGYEFHVVVLHHRAIIHYLHDNDVCPDFWLLVSGIQ